MRKLLKAVAAIATTLFFAGSLASCASQPSKELTVVVHDSVAISDELLASFTSETGLTVKIIRAGDAGAMTNKLVLTKDQPIGDLVYGIDNTFAGVALENAVIDGKLTAIDYGDVCINYDKTWFSKNEQAAPTSIADLVKPEFRELTVVQNPATSSAGLAFLAATVSVFGDPGYQDFWKQMKINEVKVTAGWEDAYFTDFSGSSGKGDFPIVLSYSSSPASEVRENGESQTEALLDGCYRQTEFAGVLNKAKNKAGAQKFIEFLLGEPFQSQLAESMYVYPVNPKATLPEYWQQFAPKAANPVGGELDVNANREKWLKAWSEIFSG